MKIEDIRRANLRRWVAKNGVPPKEKSYFSQLSKGDSSFGERAARRLELAYSMGEGYLDSANQADAGVPSTKNAEHIFDFRDARRRGHATGDVQKDVRGPGEHTNKNTDPGPDSKGQYPLISWVQAGAWETIVDNFAPGDADEWLDSPVRVSGESYYLRVRGESMYDPLDHKSFKHGEIILVDPHRDAENGSFVIVRLDDELEATFKQLIIEGEKRFLKALNPTWPNRIFEVNGNATICGVVRTKLVEYV